MVTFFDLVILELLYVMVICWTFVFMCTTRGNCRMNYSSFLNPVIGTVHPYFWCLLVSPTTSAIK